jgi:hypothetical protein
MTNILHTIEAINHELSETSSTSAARVRKDVEVLWRLLYPESTRKHQDHVHINESPPGPKAFTGTRELRGRGPGTSPWRCDRCNHLTETRHVHPFGNVSEKGGAIVTMPSRQEIDPLQFTRDLQKRLISRSDGWLIQLQYGLRIGRSPERSCRVSGHATKGSTLPALYLTAADLELIAHIIP